MGSKMGSIMQSSLRFTLTHKDISDKQNPFKCGLETAQDEKGPQIFLQQEMVINTSITKQFSKLSWCVPAMLLDLP